MSADRHLADLYLAFVPQGGLRIRARTRLDATVGTAQDSCFLLHEFYMGYPTRATLQIVRASLNETLDRAKRDATRLGDV